MLSLINPVPQREPFDHPDWLFEAKFDGFCAVRGQLIACNGHRMQLFEKVFDLLPAALCSMTTSSCLMTQGALCSTELLFGHHRPTYVAFDLLIADGVNLRPLPLTDRKARLAEISTQAAGWIALRGRAGVLPGRGRR